MDQEHLTAIIVAVFACSGFWTFLTAIITKIFDKKSSKNLMIKGLGHDRIIALCEKYLAQGWLTSDEFENLHDYLFEPYVKMGGNGTAKKLMADVEKLPIRKKEEAGTTKK